MRIVKILFSSLFSLLIFGIVSAVITREVLLFLGTKRVTNSLYNLKNVYNRKTYLAKCLEKGGDLTQGEASTIAQLRFVSSTEFVTEILCDQLSIEPIVIEHQQLPLLVKKVPGSAGIIWGKHRSGLILAVLGRQKIIAVEDELEINLANKDDLGISPLSTCGGYGYSCCQFESAQGLGEKFEGVIDCPKSCYATCEDRPVILTFNSQPALDRDERTLLINSQESVVLNFVLDGGNGSSINAHLDYGDGTSQDFSEERAMVEHTYTCAAQLCRYQVKLTAQNEQGISTAELPINTFVIMVKGG